MAYQFIHIEGYARVGSEQRRAPKKGKTGKVQVERKWSASEIVAEAERRPDACQHVAEPKPPVILYGGSPSEALKMAEEWANQAKDAQGRKLRKDGLCMLAGVVSLPAERKDDWHLFKEAVIDELQKRHGGRLRSAVEHIDEEHPHLHFYLVPFEGERFEVLHPGRLAAFEAAQQGGKKGDQNAAYKLAMRGYQDEFANNVAARFGLSRIGPARRRLSRKAWQLEKAQAKALSAAAVPAGMGLDAHELDKLVIEQRRLMPDVLESNEEQAARLNGLLAKRAQPLLLAAKNAEKATEQAQRFVKKTNEKEQQINRLKARVAELESTLSLFMPEELEEARLRRQRALEEQAQKARSEEIEAEKLQRIRSIPSLLNCTVGAARTFIQNAMLYLNGLSPQLDSWGKVEGQTIYESIAVNGQEPESVFSAVCELSPLRVEEKSHKAVSEFINKNLHRYQAEFHSKDRHQGREVDGQ